MAFLCVLAPLREIAFSDVSTLLFSSRLRDFALII